MGKDRHHIRPLMNVNPQKRFEFWIAKRLLRGHVLLGRGDNVPHRRAVSNYPHEQHGGPVPGALAGGLVLAR